MKDIKFTIGLTLIILCFLACTISYYLLVFGLPIFFVGAIFVFVSKKRLSTKIVTTLAPILLWLPGTYLFLSWYGKTTPETFLIPSDFQGKFRVVYGEECGIEPKIKKGRRILEIPSNGILVIKPEFEAGIINHEYYLIDDKGKRIKTNGIIDFKQRINNLPAVMLSGSGNFAGPMADGSFSSESELSIHYSDFYVYNRDTTDVEDFKFSQRFDSLTNVIVDTCRK